MRFPAVVVCVTFSLVAVPSRSQEAVAPIGSVRAELFKSFQTNSAAPGQVIYFRSLEPLQTASCTLAQNTQLVGTVDTLHRTPEGVRSLTVAMSFAPVACAGRASKRVLPLLVALQKHHEIDDPGHVPLSTAGFQFLVSAGMNTSLGGSPNSDVVLTTRDAGNVGTGSGSSAKPLLAGQVDGIEGVTLELPTVSPATTLVFARDQALSTFETTFYLAFVPLPDTALGGPAEDAEVCLASGCPELVSPTSELASGNVQWSTPLTSLGFKSRAKHQVAAVENNASVHFLGQDQVLLTFPSHELGVRSGPSGFDGNSRQIRAVLLARRDGHVLKTVDWQVPDDAAPYVWTFGRDAVLANLGKELVLFGPDLEPEHRFILPGPLVSLSAAPGGEAVLLIAVHATESAKGHGEILSTPHPAQPATEEYEMAALDPHLLQTANRLLRGTPQQPAVIGGAVITPQLLRAGVWRISRTSGAAPNSILATVRSNCVVHLSALRGNLVLAQGCVPDHPETTWYRVLNEKGVTLLKGTHDRLSLMLQADMDASGSHFGVASMQFNPTSTAKGSSPHMKGPLEESLAVYRSDTGQLQFATKFAAGAPEANHFALSPEGDVLTVITGEQVQTFDLPSAPN